ncbi:hypothetical protein Bbelb_196760 [Branchiostoma belcheri]|nr:hypothetical protein Bbelb_196760 [Branchiostoma belcheri]
MSNPLPRTRRVLPHHPPKPPRIGEVTLTIVRLADEETPLRRVPMTALYHHCCSTHLTGSLRLYALSRWISIAVGKKHLGPRVIHQRAEVPRGAPSKMDLLLTLCKTGEISVDNGLAETDDELAETDDELAETDDELKQTTS